MKQQQILPGPGTITDHVYYPIYHEIFLKNISPPRCFTCSQPELAHARVAQW